jgi:hypothetical protein
MILLLRYVSGYVCHSMVIGLLHSNGRSVQLLLVVIQLHCNQYGSAS